MEVGSEIRRRRLARGWTLEGLAERSGLSAHYLSTVETNKRDPSLSTITSIANALETPVGELVGPPGRASLQAMEAARLFDASSAEIREGVIQILRASAKRPKTAKRE